MEHRGTPSKPAPLSPFRAFREFRKQAAGERCGDASWNAAIPVESAHYPGAATSGLSGRPVSLRESNSANDLLFSQSGVKTGNKPSILLRCVRIFSRKLRGRERFGCVSQAHVGVSGRAVVDVSSYFLSIPLAILLAGSAATGDGSPDACSHRPMDKS